MKEYLGDAVYAEWDGYYIKLTTEDGIQATNTIYLEPEVVDAFEKFRMKILKHLVETTAQHVERDLSNHEQNSEPEAEQNEG